MLNGEGIKLQSRVDISDVVLCCSSSRKRQRGCSRHKLWSMVVAHGRCTPQRVLADVAILSTSVATINQNVLCGIVGSCGVSAGKCSRQCVPLLVRSEMFFVAFCSPQQHALASSAARRRNSSTRKGWESQSHKGEEGHATNGKPERWPPWERSKARSGGRQRSTTDCRKCSSTHSDAACCQPCRPC